jgi:hypothetical protein
MGQTNEFAASSLIVRQAAKVIAEKQRSITQLSHPNSFDNPMGWVY